MPEKVYLRPVAFLYGAAAAAAIEAGGALPLAGGPIAFGAVELIEGLPGQAKRAIARTTTIQAMAAEEPVVQGILEQLTRSRPAIAGLTFERPRIMGIVNATPDSFSDGGDHASIDAVVAHGLQLQTEGADILDIGGESTRPGADFVPEDEECKRVLPVLDRLRTCGLPLSLDTRKPAVMKQGAESGASLINDVSGLTFSENSAGMAASTGLPVIIMHAQGDPKTMQDNPVYKDTVLEVYDFLEARIAAAVEAGIGRENIIADPGIGFGKTLQHNLELFASLSIFHGLGVPLLIGASRKGLIREVSGAQHPKERVPGSIAAMLAACAQGVQILRVHDVAPARQALSVWLSAQSGREIN